MASQAFRSFERYVPKSRLETSSLYFWIDVLTFSTSWVDPVPEVVSA